ncbi:hypothetical protein ACJX0J_033923, partial [Zea mays]
FIMLQHMHASFGRNHFSSDLHHVLVRGEYHVAGFTCRFNAAELVYTPSIDIWSVGCIFAKLLTGSHSFQGRILSP